MHNPRIHSRQLLPPLLLTRNLRSLTHHTIHLQPSQHLRHPTQTIIINYPPPRPPPSLQRQTQHTLPNTSQLLLRPRKLIPSPHQLPRQSQNSPQPHRIPKATLTQPLQPTTTNTTNRKPIHTQQRPQTPHSQTQCRQSTATNLKLLHLSHNTIPHRHSSRLLHPPLQIPPLQSQQQRPRRLSPHPSRLQQKLTRRPPLLPQFNAPKLPLIKSQPRLLHTRIPIVTQPSLKPRTHTH